VKNVISMPVQSVNMSFNRGAQYARQAVEQGLSWNLAYSTAVDNSIHYDHPEKYMRGFVSAYGSEEEKRILAS